MKDPFLRRWVNGHRVSQQQLIDTWCWRVLGSGACPVYCRMFSSNQASPFQMPVSFLQLWQPKNVTSTLPYIPRAGAGGGVTGLPPLRITVLSPSRTILPCPSLLQELMKRSPYSDVTTDSKGVRLLLPYLYQGINWPSVFSLGWKHQWWFAWF